MGYVLLALWIASWFINTGTNNNVDTGSTLTLVKLLHYALMIVLGFILWMFWTIFHTA